MKSKLKNSRGAFALLTTMLLLVLLIAVTAELSTLAATGAMSTQRGVQSLHHQLAVDSAILWIHEQLPSKEGREPDLYKDLETLGQAKLTFDIGKVHVEALLRSDAAKLNPTRWQRADQQGMLSRKLSTLQQRFSLSGRPQLQPIASEVNGPRYRWFDQVIGDAQPESFFRWNEQLGTPPTETVWTDVITFWGDGKIDLRYASADVLEATLEDLCPGLAETLLAARTANRSMDIVATALANVPDDLRNQIAERLTFGARRFAIRLQTSIGADRRQWYLVVNLGGEKPQVLHRSQLTW